MSAQGEHLPILQGDGVLLSTLPPDEGARSAAETLFERRTAFQENVRVPPREIVDLMRVVVPVTGKRFVALANQERKVVDDNRLDPQLAVLGTERHTEAFRDALRRIATRPQLHPIRQSPSEADLVAVAQNAGFLLDADPVHGRAVLAFQVSDIEGAVLGKDSCMSTRKFGYRILIIGLERRFRPADGKQIVFDADFTQFRMGYGSEHDVQVLIYRCPHLRNQGMIRSHGST